MEFIPNRITGVLPNSIAEELELSEGDILLSINETPVHDIIDYKFLLSDEYVVLEVQDRSGEITIYEIEKDFDEDIGLTFSNPLIEDAKSCRNKCIFCFIDQLPKGMRETLYFKDDDSRLSFLQGNFVTMTNLSDEEIDRIIAFRLTPIKISVHTTDPDLRVKMLKNPRAGLIMQQMQKLYDAGLTMHAQIVLVPGINDGQALAKTVEDLTRFYPVLESVAIVPVGITRFREGLDEVTPFNPSSAKDAILQVHEIQQDLLQRLDTRFVFLSDEFYALSNTPLPLDSEYEGYPQLENGVGLLSNLIAETAEALQERELSKARGKFAIATGVLAAPYLKKLVREITKKAPHVEVDVVEITNEFFGGAVTVSGLITGSDILTQFTNPEDYNTIWIPESMLRSQSDVFLDDIRLGDLSQQMKREVIALPVEGLALVDAILGGNHG